jgi:serine/threonine-protein kinase
MASGRQEGRDKRPEGTVIAGRYRLLGFLGRGGMGEVYRAADLELGEDIAIKFIHRCAVRGEMLARRARDEVRLARLVTHPNVTRLHDIGEDEAQLFITMEYVSGEDLKTLLQRVGRLSNEKAIDVAQQLCFGLGAAHDKGVLHRDLKPANVMLDATGQVRIMDFGIANLSSDAERQAVLAGTPPYMAPELFRGVEPSIQSDLYALGLVLYEAVTATAYAGPRETRWSSSARSAYRKSSGLFSHPIEPSAIGRCVGSRPPTKCCPEAR